MLLGCEEVVIINPDALVATVVPPVDIIEMAPPELSVEIISPPEVVVVPNPPVDSIEIVVPVAGLKGDDGTTQLFDSSTAPDPAPDTYLRFERDIDGDVQAIYLGTVD